MTVPTDNLNPSQLEAVHHKDGPCLVLAGPGSGKTRVVTHRIAWLIEQGVPPWRILALTFTNKAADEMKNRVGQLVPGRRVWIGTFHRFCAQILRSYANLLGYDSNFTIYDVDESKQILTSLIDKNELPNGVDAAKIANAISWAKNGLILPDRYVPKEGHLLGKVVERVYPEYQKGLKRANAVDFDDLLLLTAVLLRDNPEVRRDLDARYQYILVDEYQDTNLAQYAIARALSIDYPNLSVTGDPDQSIYGWRGANIKNILDFEKDFKDVKVIRLEQNYRSTPEILRTASELIRHNVFRKKKELYTGNETGTLPRIVVCLNHQEEADFIAAEIASEIANGKRKPRDYAIFYRMNALSRNLEHAMHKHGVPFQLVRGLEFFNRKEIKDIVAYLQLVYNLNDTVSLFRVINTPTRGIGKTSVQKIEEYANRKGISLWEAARQTAEYCAAVKQPKKRNVGIPAEEMTNSPSFGFNTTNELPPKLTEKCRRSLAEFIKLIDLLRETARSADLEFLLSVLLKETGYITALKLENTEEDQQRLANVQELLSEAREFDTLFDESEKESDNSNEPDETIAPYGDFERLGRFLERAALVSDVDAWESDSDRVSLMTFHAAKGLEFPVVYIIALEENILPHERSINDKNQLEEERRLLFVGITRAREELRITRTRYREYRGMLNSSILSRFLFEIPTDCIRTYMSPDEFTGKDSVQIAPAGSDEIVYEFRPNPDSFKKNPIIDPFEKYYQTTSQADSNLNNTEKTKRKKNSEEPVFFQDGPHLPEPVRVYLPEQSAPLNKKKKKRPDTSEFDGIDEVPVYEEEVELEIDEFGHARPKQPEKKSLSRDNKKFTRPDAITIGADLLENNKNNPANSIEKKKNLESIVSVGALIRHPDYGIGVVKEIFGPRGSRIVAVEFLSGIGLIDLNLNDPALAVLPNKKK